MPKSVRKTRAGVHDVKDSFGFRIWTGLHSRKMSGFHRHDDVEVNFVHEGRMTYVMGPSRTVIEPNRFAIFWAALPHVSLDSPPNTKLTWITLPLAWVLQWRLPDVFMNRLVSGETLSDDSQPDLDKQLLARWQDDLTSKDQTLKQIITTELEMRIRRMAVGGHHQSLSRKRRVESGEISKVERMSGYIATQYAKPLQVKQIASQVDLNPHYAMTLFREAMGISLMAYVTRHRISHAQRLLATTDLPIVEIALDAGFGSLSRFYEAFGKECGCTPRNYRKQMQP